MGDNSGTRNGTGGFKSSTMTGRKGNTSGSGGSSSSHVYKLLILGESGAGKSSILHSFIHESPSEEHSQTSTIGVDHKTKNIIVNDKSIKLAIWDTAGQEKFSALVASFYRGAHGLILVYDVTSKRSFERLKFWMDQFNLHNDEGYVAKMIIGNKIDKVDERVIERTEANELAKGLGTLYTESSAKENIGIKQAFEELTIKMLEMNESRTNESTRTAPSSVLDNHNTSNLNNGSCNC